MRRDGVIDCHLAVYLGKLQDAVALRTV
jgi:hypothetical protein